MRESPLDRFLKAQIISYDKALSEIKNGRKSSHWIWFVFPQLYGLGNSEMCRKYGIRGICEAKAYLAHPILSRRLKKISKALLLHKDKPIEEILGDMGEIDAKKLRSSMTLFAFLSKDGSVYHKVLDCFYNGEADKKTLKMIENELKEGE